MPARLARIDERVYIFSFNRRPISLAHDESVRRTVASYELGDEKSGGGLGLGWAGLEPAANALKGQ